LLGEAERRTIERHVRACEACRAELEALRALTARLAALPRTIAPETDLLPGIHARIRWGSARPLRPRYALAAAAVLLVALGAVLALVVTRDAARPPIAAEASHEPGASSPAAEFRALDARYPAAARELLTELEALEDALP